VFPLIQTFRDFRDFVEAKRRKHEPIRWRAKGAGAAIYRPRNAQSFANFRATLRGVGDWGQASERVDSLESALRRRHATGLPLPHKIIQNDDRSLALFWEGVMIRCMTDGLVSLIGGAEGIKATRVTTELLDALAFQSRIQRAS